MRAHGHEPSQSNLRMTGRDQHRTFLLHIPCERLQGSSGCSFTPINGRIIESDLPQNRATHTTTTATTTHPASHSVSLVLVVAVCPTV